MSEPHDPTAAPLPQLPVTRKTGSEPFHAASGDLPFNLLEFWQWSSSDLANNTLRGKLAEFLVAKALGVDGAHRVEWDAFDVLDDTDGGRIKIEVKSSAYLQSWGQKKESKPVFSIAPARSWDAATNTYAQAVTRPSDLYVFALLAHRNKATLDPLNVDQWEFLAVQTSNLNKQFRTQKTIALGGLKRIGASSCKFEDLRMTIRGLARIVAGSRPGHS